MSFGRHLRTLRLESGVSRAGLARRAGVPVMGPWSMKQPPMARPRRQWLAPLARLRSDRVAADRRQGQCGKGDDSADALRGMSCGQYHSPRFERRGQRRGRSISRITTPSLRPGGAAWCANSHTRSRTASAAS
jgi:hypothetical protein